MRRGLLLAVVPILAGCGSQGASPTGRAELNGGGRAASANVLGLRGSEYRSWGSLRAASQRPPGALRTDPPASALLDEAEAAACDAALADVHAGATRQAVLAAFGAPDRGLACLGFAWTPAAGSVDGARICFAGGRVVRVQTALHA